MGHDAGSQQFVAACGKFKGAYYETNPKSRTNPNGSLDGVGGPPRFPREARSDQPGSLVATPKTQEWAARGAGPRYSKTSTAHDQHQYSFPTLCHACLEERSSRPWSGTPQPGDTPYPVEVENEPS